MGAADSKQQLATQGSLSEVTTVHGGSELSRDPCLTKLEALEVTQPLLNPQPSDPGLKELLLRRTASFSGSMDYGALDATTTQQLYELYEEWQKTTAATLSRRQEELGNKIEGVEALELKLLQRLNFTSSVIKSTAAHLEDVHPLRLEVAQMKRNLRATIQTYNALCSKIEELGPHWLKETPKRISLRDRGSQ